MIACPQLNKNPLIPVLFLEVTAVGKKSLVFLHRSFHIKPTEVCSFLFLLQIRTGLRGVNGGFVVKSFQQVSLGFHLMPLPLAPEGSPSIPHHQDTRLERGCPRKPSSIGLCLRRLQHSLQDVVCSPAPEGRCFWPCNFDPSSQPKFRPLTRLSPYLVSLPSSGANLRKLSLPLLPAPRLWNVL